MDLGGSIAGYPRRLLRRIAAACHGFGEHGCSLLAAAMAYYFALSLFPLLMVLVAGLGVVMETTAIGQDARDGLLTTIEQQASPQLAEQIGRAIDVVSDNASASGPFGIVVLLVTSLIIFSQVDQAFNRIWQIADDPEDGWLMRFGRLAFRRLKAFLMLLGAGAFVLVATIASLVWSGIRAAIEPTIEVAPEVDLAFGMTTTFLLNVLAFTIVYRFVPRAHIPWTAALGGACLAALLWEAGRQVLAIYLVRQGLPTAYGVIGSFLAVMLWAYYAMLIAFFAAEYTRAVWAEGNHVDL